MGKHLDPAASKFSPSASRQNNAALQASSTSSYLDARVLNLEERHAGLQEDVIGLKELCHALSSTVDRLNKRDLPVHAGPFRTASDIEASLQNAKCFGIELERLKEEAHGSVNNSSDSTAKKSTPPHLRRNRVESSIGDSPKQSQAVIALIDSQAKQQLVPAPTPRPSPKITVRGESESWKPHHITTLAPLAGNIPCADVTFHPDFLANHLGGIPWSPGLRFVKGKGPCILKNRTYYQLDLENEPYLPQAPGMHGAKLTAFFNKAPEEEFGGLFDADSNSYENVPMFVLVNKRYVYYGNYSQTRWSDKLDHETMATKVPERVKNFWAEELASPTREEWVTEELKKHFFRRPEYSGRIFAAPDKETTVNSAEDAKLTEKMVRDVRKYVDELRQWDREASMKTAMIKKQSILDAFNASDMDETPALRLWWEYLECVDWKKDFYDLLVTLQKREGQKYA
ncbi:hypothetical protein GGP41_002982 [Bipolaris sorokiniana]|uniref:DUF6697 domain-containing protein n=2 Tax=Cochliobolus sativus TaxID=45130 RepID=A0A8H5Z824_COCSA|nr:uncharacterized protein COCSADRAFT_140871 [Bipolaris sorokiniana ND90Pr]EMD64742.1 hypothetical protein COCSADRAFT_140871 [Bipolaris sorokiniana ND90Pr]KAF5845348.1 hypothetical protein GGP41_002982 [Bipolaris sorokiniana]